MTAKVTFLFHHQSRADDAPGKPVKRSYGWSESWYTTAEFGSQTFNDNCQEWRDKRAALLGVDSSIVAHRSQIVGPTNAIYLDRRVTGGTSSLAVDTPFQSLLYYPRAGATPNRRQTILRAVPDARIVTGEYKHEQNYTDALKAFWAMLMARWLFKGKDMSGVSARIRTITPGSGSTYNVVLEDALAVNNDDAVQIVRAYELVGRTRGAKCFVSGVTDPKNFSISGWPYTAAKRGRIRLVAADTYHTPNLGTTEIINPKVTKRDTGRPFDLSRGRQSARRA